MTTEQGANGKAGLSEDRQWELALASLNRADQSTNYLRTLMFVAAGGLIFFVLPELRSALPKTALFAHLAAAALAGLAICILLYSWHIQRVKARERFGYLRDGNYDSYLQYDKAVETISSKRDSRIDFLSFVILLAAFALELVARYQALSEAMKTAPVPGVHV